MKAKINDFQMYYEDMGKGIPVVFIHGMSGDTKEWAPVIPELSREIRCIVVDLRGHGQSDKPDQPYSMSLLAKDVATLLDQLGVNSAYFCGFSMGGYVAQKAALSYPEKVRGLILVNSAPNIPEHTVKVAGKWAEILLNSGLEAFVDAQVNYAFHPIFRRRHEAIINIFRENKRIPPSETPGRINKGSQIEPIDFRKKLKEIKTPILIIHGSDDQIVPVESAELMHKQIPNSQLAIFPFCGHLLIMERPKFFIDLLLYFIEKTEKTREKTK
ncbi:MAG: alpha/beta fold hydrolase [Candidatus Lokiarchaeia archaeon]